MFFTRKFGFKTFKSEMDITNDCNVIVFGALLLMHTVASQGFQDKEMIETIFDKQMPSYEKFTDELYYLQESVLEKYPKYATKIVNETEEVIITFPPPKGSTISRDTNYKNMFTMTTDIHIRILVERFVRMNVEEQSLTLVVQEIFTWDDGSLHDATIDKYPNFQMDVGADRVWIPQIYATKVFEAIVLQEAKYIQVTPGSSNPDFDCHMKRTMLYTIPCSVDVRNFPFDVHNCSLVLTQPPSWNYRLHFIPLLDENAMMYDTMNIYLDDYYILQWHFIDWSNSITNSLFAYDPDYNTTYMMDEFQFNIKLQRSATFYFVVLLLPCFLLNLLTLVIFTLPMKDLERENFSMNLLLSYVVLILIVVESSPPSGNTMPLLGLYTIICTAIVMLTFGMSVILIEINEHYKEKRRNMSPFLIKLIDNKFCKKLFTNKDTYSCLYDTYPAEREINKNAPKIDINGEKVFVPAMKLREVDVEIQWKVFCKFLNFAFFLITLAAHIVVPLVLFFMSF